MTEEYPPIHEDSTIVCTNGDGKRMFWFSINTIWVDEGGKTQVRVTDRYNDTVTLTVDDIHKKVDQHPNYFVE